MTARVSLIQPGVSPEADSVENGPSRELSGLVLHSSSQLCYLGISAACDDIPFRRHVIPDPITLSASELGARVRQARDEEQHGERLCCEYLLAIDESRHYLMWGYVSVRQFADAELGA